MRRWLLVELGVLATLLVSFLTVPLPLPHVTAGTMWVALMAVHGARRRRSYTALLRSARSSVAGRRPRRLVASTMLIGSAAMVTLSGFAQWADVAAAIPWHAGSSMLLIVLAVFHASRRLWWMRRRRAQFANSESARFVTFL
jgi:hypothetical protein